MASNKNWFYIFFIVFTIVLAVALQLLAPYLFRTIISALHELNISPGAWHVAHFDVVIGFVIISIYSLVVSFINKRFEIKYFLKSYLFFVLFEVSILCMTFVYVIVKSNPSGYFEGEIIFIDLPYVRFWSDLWLYIPILSGIVLFFIAPKKESNLIDAE